MVKIRLQRKGVRNKVFYRVVAIDERNKMNGLVQEILGTWHPSKNLKEIDTKKVAEWVKRGAQVTPAVEKLLTKSK